MHACQNTARRKCQKRGRNDIPSEYERNTKRSEVFGYVLLAGLGVELVFAVALSKPWLDWVSTILSDALIVIGVWGEIHFGRRARIAGDAAQADAEARISEANARASEANRLAEEERTARIKLEAQVAPRNVSEELFKELLTLRGVVAAVGITAASDVEAQRFATQLMGALQSSGVAVSMFGPRIGLIWPNLYIVLPEPVADFNWNPLYAAFIRAGVWTGCGDRRNNVLLPDLPPDLPIIMVGEKGISYPQPTFIWAPPAVTPDGTEESSGDAQAERKA